MDFHKMTSKIDMDTLDEIIEALEGKMTEPGEGKPFKKKTVVALDMEPKDDSMDLHGDHGQEDDEKDDLDDADLKDLLEMYSKMKG